MDVAIDAESSPPRPTRARPYGLLGGLRRPATDAVGQRYGDQEECIDSDACVEACPGDAITAEDHLPPEWQRFIAVDAACYPT